jgi:hypothetical protein
MTPPPTAPRPVPEPTRGGVPATQTALPAAVTPPRTGADTPRNNRPPRSPAPPLFPSRPGPEPSRAGRGTHALGTALPTAARPQRLRPGGCKAGRPPVPEPGVTAVPSQDRSRPARGAAPTPGDRPADGGETATPPAGRLQGGTATRPRTRRDRRSLPGPKPSRAGRGTHARGPPPGITLQTSATPQRSRPGRMSRPRDNRPPQNPALSPFPPHAEATPPMAPTGRLPARA